MVIYRLVRLSFLVSIISVCAYASESIDSCAHDDAAFRCVKYVKNYDGDTVTFEIPNVHPLLGKNISVRVKHVDTPEIKGSSPCEKEAARAAKRLVENLMKNAKQINLREVERDKYFRILADIEYDGNDLKEVLFKNKLAYPYEGKTKEKIDWCKFKDLNGEGEK